MASPREPTAEVRKRPRPWQHTLALVILAVAVATLVAGALFVVPIGHPFSFTVPSVPSCLGETNVTFPQGAFVSGSWSNGQNDPVVVSITASTGVPVYRANGTTGSFSFTSGANFYEFVVLAELAGAGCTPVTPTSFTGTAAIPLV